MEDDRVCDFERALWIGGEDIYQQSVDANCVMVLPEEPFVMSGNEAIEAVSATPR